MEVNKNKVNKQINRKHKMHLSTRPKSKNKSVYLSTKIFKIFRRKNRKFTKLPNKNVQIDAKNDAKCYKSEIT